MSRIDVEGGQDGLAGGRLVLRRKMIRRLCVAAAAVIVLASAVIFFVDDELKRRRANFIYGCEVAEVDVSSCALLADAYGYPDSIVHLARYLYVRHELNPYVPHLSQ